MITKERAIEILQIYKEAWTEQNIDKILRIFTSDGIYHERALKEPFVGHEQIASYWK